MKFFTEDKVENPLNLDVLTPMSRVNLAPWYVSQRPMYAQAYAVVEEFRSRAPEDRGLSLEWILARVDAAHKLPESAPEEILPQLLTRAWDTDAEYRRLLPLAEALYDAQTLPSFIYTNREAWFGATWTPACRPLIVAACHSALFLERLSPNLRHEISVGGPEILFNTLDNGQLNPDFDRELSNEFDSFIAEMNIRAVREVLERLGLLRIGITCVQSFAVRPRLGVVPWERYDGNLFKQRVLVDGRPGNDQIYFENGYEYSKEFLYGQGTPWEWSAFVNEIRKLRAHLGSGLDFVPTIAAPGAVGEVRTHRVRWLLTAEYLRHAAQTGVRIVDVFNPAGLTTPAAENTLANLARELRTIDVRPSLAKSVPARGALSIRSGSKVTTRDGLVSRLVVEEAGH